MERLTQPGHEYHSLEFMEDGIYIYMNRLREYEDTGLTPVEIQELKERDTAKPARPISDRSLCAICLNCGQTIFKEYRFCPDCGQRLKREE